MRQYVGPPPVMAIYQILRDSIFELMRVGVIRPPEHLFDAVRTPGFCLFSDFFRLLTL